MKKKKDFKLPVNIFEDIVRWFRKEKHHDINTILRGHIKLVEAQRKVMNTTFSGKDPYFKPMPKPDKKKKGRK